MAPEAEPPEAPGEEVKEPRWGAKDWAIWREHDWGSSRTHRSVYYDDIQDPLTIQEGRGGGQILIRNALVPRVRKLVRRMGGGVEPDRTSMEMALEMVRATEGDDAGYTGLVCHACQRVWNPRPDDKSPQWCIKCHTGNAISFNSLGYWMEWEVRFERIRQRERRAIVTSKVVEPTGTLFNVVLF